MSKRISQSISLTPELDRFVQAQVTSGRYQTASEVIRDALRLLQDRTSLQTHQGTASSSEGVHGR
jgi:antitoxin ParD1/3/4